MTTLDHFNTETGEVNIQLFNKTEAGLAELNKLYSKVPEIKTKDDYEFVKTACSELTGLRTSIEKTRKEIKQPYIDAGRAIDDRAKEITEKIRKLEDPMKEAKKAHDEIEKRKKEERLARLREKVDAIKAYAVNARGKSASEIEDIIETVTNIDATQDFYDLTDEAIHARDNTLTELQQLHSERLEYERNERKRKEAEAQLEEQNRKQRINERLNTLRNIPMSMFNASLDELNKKIEALQKHKPSESDFEESHGEAVAAWEQVIDQLKQMIPMAEMREQQQREAEAKANEEAAEEQAKQELVSDNQPEPEQPQQEEKEPLETDSTDVKESNYPTQEAKTAIEILDFFGCEDQAALDFVEQIKLGNIPHVMWTGDK